MKITLLYASAPRQVHQEELNLPTGVTVDQALDASGWRQRFPEIRAQALTVSIWGRKAVAAQVLRDGDRLELCRSLRVDPKVARRERFVAQGARGSGLFASRRPGAKSGY
ncbi:MAG: RnfH family protein [Hydrogenophaga sp.]|jgi:putative ubiquitin-RnfH superfamily antitoxin RatB of RatAB toxin-antitoxin module|nr:RnfH family protein [Hydrogenophaga sp.]